MYKHLTASMNANAKLTNIFETKSIKQSQNSSVEKIGANYYLTFEETNPSSFKHLKKTTKYVENIKAGKSARRSVPEVCARRSVPEIQCPRSETLRI